MVLNKGTLFDPALVTDLISKVAGKSSIARLSAQKPILAPNNSSYMYINSLTYYN